ncbi:hypothetical protein KQI63_13930 [bacterium]|nr:hypothetical protein [bacterium]
MLVRELTPLLQREGLVGVAWVDRDGTTLAEAGYIPDLLAPHMVRLLGEWEQSVRGPSGSYREIHAVGWTLVQRTGESGLLLVIADEEANLGQIRLATGELMLHLDQKGKTRNT